MGDINNGYFNGEIDDMCIYDMYNDLNILKP
jgi:hypothetical protein